MLYILGVIIIPGEHVYIAAKHILGDRDESDKYKDKQLLTEYLFSALNLTIVGAEAAAYDIDRDREGPDYYSDLNVLVDFLEHCQKKHS